MASTKKLMTIGNLRTSDQVTLAALTQDALSLPLGQIEHGTLADLMALSEIPEQLSTEQAKDFGAFRDQMVREISDLPEGELLVEFLEALATIEPERVPASLRDAVEGRTADAAGEKDKEAAAALVAHLETGSPTAITLPVVAADIDASQQTGDGTPRREVLPAAPKKTRRKTTVVDERREEWIREDVLSRLAKYGSRGLKESIVVAGARHRAPWEDLSSAEVLATLRKLKRENRLRFSAGRWMMGGV